MDNHIQARVDELLLEQSEYRPLELLLAEGRLTYTDYEAWRSGEVERLETCLFGDPAGVRETLQAAAGYARRLKLEAEILEFSAWGGGAGLRFSADGDFDTLFRTAFRRRGDEIQMDLFMDSPGTALVSAVVAGLACRDWAAAAGQLRRLYAVDPGNARLGGLEQLVESAISAQHPISDAAADLETLAQTIEPLAEDLLGNDARAYLQPLWRRLDETLAGRAFDPAQPNLHCSYTAGRMLDWHAQKSAVEAESAWRERPELLRRHAGACTRLREPARALADLFALCWLAPGQAAPPTAQEWPADTLSAWTQFWELEPELEVGAFPAWLLIIRPALAGSLAPPEPGAPQTYRLVFELQRLRNAGPAMPSAPALALRARLKSLDADLFRHFIVNLGG